MARKTERPKLIIADSERTKLVKISQSRKLPIREVQRASILLSCADGKDILKIKNELNVSRSTIYKCY